MLVGNSAGERLLISSDTQGSKATYRIVQYELVSSDPLESWPCLRNRTRLALIQKGERGEGDAPAESSDGDRPSTKSNSSE
jgi:hypothetical protein